MSSFRNCGVYHSREEALQVLKAKELSSVSEIQDFVKSLSDKLNAQTDDNCKLHPFIVVEGLDGSGKTTVTKELSKKLYGVRMSTPDPQFLSLRPFFDKQPNNIRRAYYSLTNYSAALEIKKQLKARPVVLDRFWHSTAAYALAAQIEEVAGLPERGNPLYTWPEDLLPHPDIVFFLKVSEAKRLERHSRRNTSTLEEDRLAKEAKFRDVLHEAYRRMSNPKITEVNADHFPKQIVKEMMQVMADMKMP